MSSSFTIAAVTAVLKNRLENGLVQQGVGAALGADVIVSSLPPDRVATGGDERPQINLFLYQIMPHVSLRNSPSSPTTTYDLMYLISAYGASDMQIDLLIGFVVEAMRQIGTLDHDTISATLHLIAESGHSSIPLGLSNAVITTQLAELTATPQFLGLEDSSRLWSALQTRFRPSVAYRVAAVTVGGTKS